MAIHSHPDKLRILRMVFQARYLEGMRFLNRSGDIMVRIRAERPEWEAARLTLGLFTLAHKANNLVANIGTEAVDLTFGQPIDSKDGDKKAELFAEAADWLYGIVVNGINSPRTVRVGVAFQFFAPADSVEECDRLTWRIMASPFQQWVTSATKGKPVEAMSNCFVEDSETGIRRSIQGWSGVVEQPPGALPAMGFGDVQGKGGYILEIDTYTRPDEGHYPKVTIFIQDQFLAAKRIALEIYRNSVTPK